MSIVGREEEVKQLERLLKSQEAEFVAIYGRRRVGKTHLIHQYFSTKGIYLEITGMKDAPLEAQLQNFIEAFTARFYPGLTLTRPKSWRDGLRLLTNEIEKLSRKQKVILFFDELPWLASPRSGLLQALDYFWNTAWSRFSNVKLIVCGSAASWMLEHLINAKGGLHNRVTKSILLRPFSLKQTQQFLAARNIFLNEKHILDLYMVMGGIPHYLKQIEAGLSAVQNIDTVCFRREGLLHTEFDRLFSSLFDKAELHEKIIKAIATQRFGITRSALLNKLSIESGGTFNKRLGELEAAGFIQGFVPYGKKRKEKSYRVIDEYVLFYLSWIEPVKNKDYDSYWQTKVQTPAWISWSGYAFEGICFQHLKQIKQALSLDKLAYETGSWRYISPKASQEMGTQIDLLFDRNDDAITLCEIKYCREEFVIDKSYAKILHQKMDLFSSHCAPRKQLFLTLITTWGLKKNLWSEDLIAAVITLQDLFRC